MQEMLQNPNGTPAQAATLQNYQSISRIEDMNQEKASNQVKVSAGSHEEQPVTN